MAAIKTRKTSYGTLTIEQVSGGYAIYLNGKLYKSTYANLDDAIKAFDSMPN